MCHQECYKSHEHAAEQQDCENSAPDLYPKTGLACRHWFLVNLCQFPNIFKNLQWFMKTLQEQFPAIPSNDEN